MSESDWYTHPRPEPRTGIMTAVSNAYFVEVGSRAQKSDTIHLMDTSTVTHTDKHCIHYGKALCGIDVRGMGFSYQPQNVIDERTCKRCKRAENNG